MHNGAARQRRRATIGDPMSTAAHDRDRPPGERPGLPARPRGRRRLRVGDRRARQGGWRAALPGGRHQRPRRPGVLRPGLGAARRRRVRPGSASRRTVPAAGAHRRHPGRRAVGPRPARPGVGVQAAARHRRRGGPREPRPRVGHGHLVHRPGRPRAEHADGAPERGRQGPHHRRAVHDPLARRARPQARRGHRLLLHLRGRARHERVDLHRPGHRLHRRRRRGLPVRARSAPSPGRCTVAPRAAPST